MKKIIALLLALSLSTVSWADLGASLILGASGDKSATNQYEDRNASNDDYSEDRSSSDRYSGDRGSNDRYSEDRGEGSRQDDEAASLERIYNQCVNIYYKAKGNYLTLKIAVEAIKEIEKQKDSEQVGRVVLGITAFFIGQVLKGQMGSDLGRNVMTGISLAGAVTAGSSILIMILNDGRYDVPGLGLFGYSLSQLKDELKTYESPWLPDRCKANNSWNTQDFKNESELCTVQKVYDKNIRDMRPNRDHDYGLWCERIICKDPQNDCTDCK